MIHYSIEAFKLVCYCASIHCYGNIAMAKIDKNEKKKKKKTGTKLMSQIYQIKL